MVALSRFVISSRIDKGQHHSVQLCQLGLLLLVARPRLEFVCRLCQAIAHGGRSLRIEGEDQEAAQQVGLSVEGEEAFLHAPFIAVEVDLHAQQIHVEHAHVGQMLDPVVLGLGAEEVTP
ncbi:hypothetical protein [Pelomonas sp. Root1217]|uniref:hypothetical protein n=1 Tax=Pelomonas sp. Root1217 TaxID=1736430 RepID=UPI0009EB0583|nr:hypothetical protein [Pelomonas sp. Root1217]